jgi:hypothetical protein
MVTNGDVQPWCFARPLGRSCASTLTPTPARSPKPTCENAAGYLTVLGVRTSFAALSGSPALETPQPGWPRQRRRC